MHAWQIYTFVSNSALSHVSIFKEPTPEASVDLYLYKKGGQLESISIFDLKYSTNMHVYCIPAAQRILSLTAIMLFR